MNANGNSRVRRIGRFLTADELPQVLAGLRAFLARGMSLRAASHQLGEPKSTLARVARRHRLKRRKPARLPPRKAKLIKRLIAKGWGGWRIARAAKVSTETVWRYQQVAKFRRLIDRANTPLPCKPWRCPGGGEKLNVSICIVHGCRKPPSGGAKRPGTAKRRRKAG